MRQACTECEASLEIMMAPDLEAGYYRGLCAYCTDRRTRKIRLFEKLCLVSCIGALANTVACIPLMFLQGTPVLWYGALSSAVLWTATVMFAQFCAKSWC